MERITKQIKSHGSMASYAAAEEERDRNSSTPREDSTQSDRSNEEEDS